MSAMPRQAAAQLAPADLVERVLAVSERLADIVRRETEYLENRQPRMIGDLQEEKTRLANEYAMDVQAISLRKELIDRAPAEKVAKLKLSMTRLDEALAANQNVLGATKSVSERILKSIADAANERKAPLLGYGRNAAPARSAGRSAAIALDSRV